MNVAEAVRRIVEDAELREGTRGTVAFVRAADDVVRVLRSELERRLRDVRVILFDGGEASRAELRDLNRARDSVIRATRVVLVAVPTASLQRQARGVAADLLTTPDVSVHIEVEHDVDWEELASRLTRLMVERHRYIDLSGLLPRDMEIRRVELSKLYMDLLGPLQNRLLVGMQTLFKGDGFTAEPVFGPMAVTVVLAQPGAGKTTLLRHLVQQAPTGTSELLGSGEVPVLVPLAAYARARQERVQSLLDFVEAFAGEQLGLDTPFPLREKPWKVSFLLDGLDEIPDRSVRRKVLDEVAGWPDRHGIRHVVLTSRSYLSAEVERVSSRVETRGLRAATEADIAGYLQAFAALRGRPDSHRRLVERIRQDAALSDLAQNPLLLVFLAVLHEVDRDLPSQRTVLYRDLTELLISRWQPRRGAESGGRRRLKRADAIRVLGPLAWWMIDNGGVPATEQEILTELVRIEGMREADPDVAEARARSRMEQLQQDTALLVHDGRWAFAHLSLAEYFAGVEVSREPARREQLEADPYDPGWREVVRFALMILSDVECRDAEAVSLARALVARSRRPGRYDSRIPKLIFDIAIEGPDLPSEVVRSLVDRATTIAQVQALAEDEAWEARWALGLAIAEAPNAWADQVLASSMAHLQAGTHRSVFFDAYAMRFRDWMRWPVFRDWLADGEPAEDLRRSLSLDWYVSTRFLAEDAVFVDRLQAAANAGLRGPKGESLLSSYESSWYDAFGYQPAPADHPHRAYWDRVGTILDRPAPWVAAVAARLAIEPRLLAFEQRLSADADSG